MPSQSQADRPRPLSESLQRYNRDPIHRSLRLSSKGKLEVLDTSPRQDLAQFFFGAPSLGHDKTLEVLIAVRRYLSKGDYGTPGDEAVARLARDLMRDLETEQPLLRSMRSHLGDAFQQAIIHFVREHHLKRALLIEQEMIARWERPWKEHSIPNDLVRLSLTLTGNSAEEALDPSVSTSEKQRVQGLLKGLAKNFNEELDLSSLDGIKDEDLPKVLSTVFSEQCGEASRVLRLLKATDLSVLRVVELHIREVLHQVSGVRLVKGSLQHRYGLVHVRIEANYIALTHHMRWTVGQQAGEPSQGFSFDCEATFLFDRELQVCRRAEVLLHAPEFGRDESARFCAEVNDALQSQFPFAYT